MQVLSDYKKKEKKNVYTINGAGLLTEDADVRAIIDEMVLTNL